LLNDTSEEALTSSEIEELLQTFSSRDQDIQIFLHSKAIQFEREDKCRTYLLVGEDGNIHAYFSISTKELALRRFTVSATQRRRMKINPQDEEQRVRCFLIGQLGKNFAIETPITLKDILNEVDAIVIQAQTLVGNRLLILECNAHLIPNYQTCNFKSLPVQPDEVPPTLETMYKFIN
jgi:hypothetical protein|tara:strand:- start:1339 stop:1872 length:534 start_codon:yes stop_codon:yes gene_type:complete